MVVLPDSNVFIRAARAGHDPFNELERLQGEREFVTCGLVIMEVCRGLRDPRLRQRFQQRFSVMICLHTSITIWERATQLAWSLDRQGIVLPATDLVIAATALQAGATVFTHDAHFQQIPGLKVIGELAQGTSLE